MRLGIFGGSYDPVHLGHLQLAQSCQQQADLDEVWFIPAATQPFKQNGAHASDEQRLAMLELATHHEPTWQVSPIEIERGGVSYTADTLRTIHNLHPVAQLYFMMGADSLRDLPNWREPEQILRLAIPLVVSRAGQQPPAFESLNFVCSAERLSEIRAAQVDMPAMHISSSSIRECIASGEDVQAMLPDNVWSFIEREKVYHT